MNLGVFLKEFWDTVALQFFELVEERLPKRPCRPLSHRLLQLAHPIGLRAIQGPGRDVKIRGTLKPLKRSADEAGLPPARPFTVVRLGSGP